MIKDFEIGMKIKIVKEINSTNSLFFDTEEALNKFEKDIGFKRAGHSANILDMDYYRMATEKNGKEIFMLVPSECLEILNDR